MRNSNYFHALHGLRGVLCLWVLSLHLFLFLSLGMKINAEAFWGPFLTRIFWSGYLAVDVFFILSGFFISHVFLSRFEIISFKPTLHFLVSRLARLYPVHLFVLLAYATLVWNSSLPFSRICFPHDPNGTCDPFSLVAFLKNILLINAWDWFPQTSWNVNSWSISSEWAAYLVAPLLIPILARIKNGYLALSASAVVMVLMVVLIGSVEKARYFHQLFLTLLQRSGNEVGQELFTVTGPGALEFGLIRLTGGFLCGCLLYKYFQSPLYQKIKWSVIGVLATIGIILTIQTLPLYWCYLLFIPFILSVAQQEGIISRILASNVMQWFGNISYSLYMVHGVLLKLLIIAIPLYWGSDLITHLTLSQIAILLLAVTALVILVSALVYYVIEEPCRKWLKQITASSSHPMRGEYAMAKLVSE